jgi:hypothetical protein
MQLGSKIEGKKAVKPKRTKVLLRNKFLLVNFMLDK